MIGTGDTRLTLDMGMGFRHPLGQQEREREREREGGGGWHDGCYFRGGARGTKGLAAGAASVGNDWNVCLSP